jgi:hypothetical protein
MTGFFTVYPSPGFVSFSPFYCGRGGNVPCHPFMIGAAFLRKGGEKRFCVTDYPSDGLLRGAVFAGKKARPLPIVYNSYIINRIMSGKKRA